MGSISTTVPKAMVNSLWDTRAISYAGFAAQILLLPFFITAECCLLTIMAYDRYVAICNVVDQLFCEIPQILKLSCSDSHMREAGLLVASGCLAFGCFVFIVLSYGQIFRAVLRIPSQQGQHKVFSTCLPHLVVVSLFVSTGMFSYLKPPSISSPSLDLFVTVLYVVVPPALNPLIYGMRNKMLNEALQTILEQMLVQDH
ncbi:olfactory receptor 14C36-like [Cygnus olor]|uniref:olfactory receptor 14C36-like n=1 Tax=Cygnus olor TaxID=8869 RepID=UPI001ADE1460|nr:olfactory receptor 14C36-like [Cygnus olor]